MNRVFKAASRFFSTRKKPSSPKTKALGRAKALSCFVLGSMMMGTGCVTVASSGVSFTPPTPVLSQPSEEEPQVPVQPIHIRRTAWNYFAPEQGEYSNEYVPVGNQVYCRSTDCLHCSKDARLVPGQGIVTFCDQVFSAHGREGKRPVAVRRVPGTDIFFIQPRR